VLGLSAGMLALVLGAAPYVPRVVAFEAQPSPNPTPPMPAAQRAAEQPADAAMIRSVAERVAQRPRLASQARAISAAFHPRAAAIPRRLKATPPRQPVAMLGATAQEELPIQGTIVILRATQYNAYGSGVWTLCIWRVGGNNPAERQLESAVFVGSI
jgi:hypothetical protein